MAKPSKRRFVSLPLVLLATSVLSLGRARASFQNDLAPGTSRRVPRRVSSKEEDERRSGQDSWRDKHDRKIKDVRTYCCNIEDGSSWHCFAVLNLGQGDWVVTEEVIGRWDAWNCDRDCEPTPESAKFCKPCDDVAECPSSKKGKGKGCFFEYPAKLRSTLLELGAESELPTSFARQSMLCRSKHVERENGPENAKTEIRAFSESGVGALDVGIMLVRHLTDRSKEDVQLEGEKTVDENRSRASSESSAGASDEHGIGATVREFMQWVETYSKRYPYHRPFTANCQQYSTGLFNSLTHETRKRKTWQSLLFAGSEVMLCELDLTGTLQPGTLTSIIEGVVMALGSTSIQLGTYFAKLIDGELKRYRRQLRNTMSGVQPHVQTFDANPVPSAVLGRSAGVGGTCTEHTK